MTLHEWVSEQAKALAEFEKKWILDNAKNPDDFPLEMEPGDWDEMYRAAGE